jgi:hypothetical protein
MFLTVIEEGKRYRAIRYETKDVKTRILDDCLGTEVFTLEGGDADKLTSEAKVKAHELRIYVRNL